MGERIAASTLRTMCPQRHDFFPGHDGIADTCAWRPATAGRGACTQAPEASWRALPRELLRRRVHPAGGTGRMRPAAWAAAGTETRAGRPFVVTTACEACRMGSTGRCARPPARNTTCAHLPVDDTRRSHRSPHPQPPPRRRPRALNPCAARPPAGRAALPTACRQRSRSPCSNCSACTLAPIAGAPGSPTRRTFVITDARSAQRATACPSARTGRQASFAASTSHRYQGERS